MKGKLAKRRSDMTPESKRISNISMGSTKFQFEKKPATNEPTIGQILSYSKNEVGVICKYVTQYDLF